MRTGIQFETLDLTQGHNVIPMLLFHGISDTTAPIEVSDMFHKPTPYPHAISLATKMINHLCKHQIEVVIIDGNHEVSSVLHPGSSTTFLRELTAHVINGKDYKIIRDDYWENTKLRAKN
jgi:hypothetical protein